MKNYLLLLVFVSVGLYAQEMRKPDGGGEYIIEKTECISLSEYQRIHKMLQSNKDSLARIGTLNYHATETKAKKALPNNLIWPVVNHNGLNYNSAYGISNFVDHNTSFPNAVSDWNCGTRTYDLSSGYNHAGIDIFLWPFSQYLQENDKVAVVAAIGGVIIGKDNGNFDKNCAMGNSSWNAVYVQDINGNVYWYGHMKNNSLTTKNIGQSVVQGEFLGVVGSSGSSTGPHLHFEIYDATNNLIDPYSGPCNANPSLWQNQKPYFEPTINTLMTHHAAPIFPACPQLETINDKDFFKTGDLIYFGVYLHDHTANHQMQLKIKRPDNSVFRSWTHQLNPNQYFALSYWYWNFPATAQMPSGQWTFEVTFAGNTQSHKFYLNVDPANVEDFEKEDSKLNIFPNPNKGVFAVDGLDEGQYEIEVIDLSGKVVYKEKVNTVKGTIYLQVDVAATSYYILQIKDKKGKTKSGKLLIQ